MESHRTTLRTRSGLGVALGAGLTLAACAGSPTSGGATHGAGGGGGGSNSGSGAGQVARALDACGGKIFDADGKLDPAEYEKQARLWTREAIDCRLGPRFADVHPTDEPDTRPDLWAPPTILCGGDGTMASHEYGAGCDTSCSAGTDFGSTEGPALYAPDDDADPGIDRVLTYAYDGPLVSIRPQPATGGSHPDPSLSNPRWPMIGFHDQHAFAVQRTHVGWGNQAIALFADGFVGALGTRTDGVPPGNQFGFAFPANLAPTAVAVTSMNEFVLVTLWDTTAHQGKLAVFAMQGNSPMAHTWWYIGLPNAGGFWASKFLGYVDLPVATPTSLSVVTNGVRTSPHDTGEQPLASFNLVDKNGCHADVMAQFTHGGAYTNVVASHGYAIIASRWEDKVVFVDLAPLLAFYRHAYLEDLDYCNANVAPVHDWTDLPPTWFDGDDRWPYPFSNPKASASIPVVAGTFDVPGPRDVAAGFVKYSGNPVVPKAYALSDRGKLFVIAPNRVYRRWTDDPPPAGLDEPAESSADPALLAQVVVCAHPTSMQMSRGGGVSLDPLLFGGAATDPVVPAEADNDIPLIVCRGDRKLQAVAATGPDGDRSAILWELTDQQMSDPVAVDQSERGPVLTLADFDGKKLIGYQIGDLVGQGCGANDYPVHPGAPVAGQLPANRGGTQALPGRPFAITATNVN
jgi:hypothetical protein